MASCLIILFFSCSEAALSVVTKIYLKLDSIFECWDLNRNRLNNNLQDDFFWKKEKKITGWQSHSKHILNKNTTNSQWNYFGMLVPESKIIAVPKTSGTKRRKPYLVFKNYTYLISSIKYTFTTSYFTIYLSKKVGT